MINIIFAMLLAFDLPAQSDQAAGVKQMTEFFETEGRALNESLTTADTAPAGDELYLRRISVRIRPRVSFGISSVLKLEIVPEADFIWQKQLPEGYTNYKP